MFAHRRNLNLSGGLGSLNGKIKTPITQIGCNTVTGAVVSAVA